MSASQYGINNYESLSDFYEKAESLGDSIEGVVLELIHTISNASGYELSQDELSELVDSEFFYDLAEKIIEKGE